MFETYELKNFGERIRNVRKSLGYNQTEVSVETGIHRDTLRRIENGSNIVTFDTLNKLSMFLKKDLFHELAHYNTNRNLLNYYEKIDDIINSYDYEKLVNLSNNFEINFKDKSPSDFSLYEGRLIDQLRLIIRGIEKLIKKDEGIYKDSLNKATHILEIKGYYELAKKYKEITKVKYNIDLSP